MATTSRILLSGVKLGMRRGGRRRRWLGGFDHQAMAMPALGDAGGRVGLIGQLEAAGAVDEDRRYRQPALDVFGLVVLNERHGVYDVWDWQCVGVNADGLDG